MEFAKRLSKENIFIFLFLLAFPFGQIIKVGNLNPIDAVVFFGAITAVVSGYKRPHIFTYFNNFIFVALATWIFSFFVFYSSSVIYGLFYLARLASYFYFLLYLLNFVSLNPKHKGILKNSLLAVSVTSAIFGWIQFFWIPDIKPFFTYGWDEHLFRLVGTFLDPTFLGLIIVLGLLIAFSKKKRLISLFLFVSLAFTYSRASYLALFVGLAYLAFVKKRILTFAVPFIALIIIALALPTSKNHSIEFFRTFSAIARVENYKTTLEIIKKSPIFGIGYNNMCLAYNKFVGYQSLSSHACSGSDSSVLLITATMGLSGLFSFLTLANILWKNLEDLTAKAMMISLATHSLFSNSLFYPWVLGFLICYLSIYLGNKVKS